MPESPQVDPATAPADRLEGVRVRVDYKTGEVFEGEIVDVEDRGTERIDRLQRILHVDYRGSVVRSADVTRPTVDVEVLDGGDGR